LFLIGCQSNDENEAGIDGDTAIVEIDQTEVPDHPLVDIADTAKDTIYQDDSDSSVDEISNSDSDTVRDLDMGRGESDEDAPLGPAIEINIDPGKREALQKDVCGVNGNMTGGQGNYDDPEFVEFYKELGSPYIRFPGGTVANLYDWKNVRFIENSEGNPTHNERVSRVNEAWEKSEKHYDTETFLRFIAETGASFAIVINIANKSLGGAEYTKEWMEHIKSLGHSVKRVELGNELYFPGYEACYPDPSEYVAAAKEHSAAIKEVFPDCKVGLVVSSIPYTHELPLDENNSQVKRAALWDSAADKADFHDAVVIHMYTRIGLTGNSKEPHPDTDVLASYKFSFSYNDSRYPNVINSLKSSHPDKEIWITEYNIQPWLISAENDNKLSMSDTFLGRLFAAEFLIKQLSTPEVRAANWHNIPDVIYNHISIEKASAFDFLNIFKEPLDECSNLASIDIKGQNFVSGDRYYAEENLKEFSEVRGAFFFNDSYGYLFIVNRLDTNYAIKSLKISGKSFKALEIATISPETSDEAGLKSKGHKIETDKLTSHRDIVIKPYSLNRIKIKLED